MICFVGVLGEPEPVAAWLDDVAAAVPRWRQLLGAGSAGELSSSGSSSIDSCRASRHSNGHSNNVNAYRIQMQPRHDKACLVAHQLSKATVRNQLYRSAQTHSCSQILKLSKHAVLLYTYRVLHLPHTAAARG
jgi:hypothetical protein